MKKIQNIHYKLSVPKKKTHEAVLPVGFEILFRSFGGLAICVDQKKNKIKHKFKQKMETPSNNFNKPCQAKGKILSFSPCKKKT